MKTILVDAFDTFVFVEGGVFQEMQNLLDGYANRKVIVTSANEQKIRQYGLDKVGYEVFTLNHNPEKTDPEYFKQLLEEFSLNSDDVIYFEHNPEAVTSAESIGIRSYYYDPVSKDLAALKEFLDANM